MNVKRTMLSCGVTMVATVCLLFGGSPAARLGDLTTHGGSVLGGSPDVMIQGMPAARLGDWVTCPRSTPGLPPVPHVGGNISGGCSPTVFINGMPAARTGSTVTEVGAVSAVMGGGTTVIIGP